MTQKRSYKHYPKEFKDEVFALVLEQDYTLLEAAKSLGITSALLYKWGSALNMLKSIETSHV